MSDIMPVGMQDIMHRGQSGLREVIVNTYKNSYQPDPYGLGFLTLINWERLN